MANIFQKVKTGIGKAGDALSSALRLEKSGLQKGAVNKTPPAVAQELGRVVDFRPKLVVPYEYTSSDLVAGPSNVIRSARGIIFPYTPSIRQEYSANFNERQVTHSNYPFFFYQNSSIGRINLSFTLTVQNKKDAHYYLAVVHLLRSLVKMKFGIDDAAGSPPPICRLYGYGQYMFENVPVSISNFNIDLENNIDYYTAIPDNDPILALYGPNNTVPVMSTFQLGLVPMYSRAEMKNFSVEGFLKDSKSKGYL